MPIVCGEKTMYNPTPTQAAMSTGNTHNTNLFRAVSAYTLHLPQLLFRCDNLGRRYLVVRNP